MRQHILKELSHSDIDRPTPAAVAPSVVKLPRVVNTLDGRQGLAFMVWFLRRRWLASDMGARLLKVRCYWLLRQTLNAKT